VPWRNHYCFDDIDPIQQKDTPKMGQSQPGKLKTTDGRCPICSDNTDFAFRPFCSRRCANVDLSRWLRGAYAIAVLADEDEDGDSATAAEEANQIKNASDGDETK